MDKSLYMADFLKVRQELGTIQIPTIHKTLFTNLYSELNQDKGQLVKQDKEIFFPDLNESEEKESKPEEMKHIIIQPISTSKDIANNPNIKTLIVDPETMISKSEKKKK